MSDGVPNPILELRSVSASSGGFEILKDVSVSFEEGVTTAVLGAAGSGKSTLLKTAAGLIVPESGAVLFRGTSLASFSEDDERYFRSRSSFVFQDSALWANQTIFNNIALPLRVHKPWMGESDVAEKIRLVLERVGYDGGVAYRPADLSAGEQKLVSLARALVLDPELVFMDDPTTGLDEDAAERVDEVLTGLHETGKAVILVTSDMDLVHRVADRILIIRQGRKAAYGNYDDIASGGVPEAAGLAARLRARGERRRSGATGQGTVVREKASEPDSSTATPEESAP